MSTRTNRQSFLGKNSDEILGAATVAIVGNCGGGSHVAQQLAHVGIGKFLLIDPDTVEEVNLNRMIGSRPADAETAAPKTKVLERLIRSIQPRAAVTRFDAPWQEVAAELRGATLVVGCIDGYALRGELEAYCRRFLLPYIDVGMDVCEQGEHFSISGQVITSLPGRPCMRCLGFLTEAVLAEEAAQYGAAGARPQVVWPNGVLASIAVGQVVRLLTPWNNEPICPHLEYDGNRQRVGPSNRLAHIDLSQCRHFPASEVGDPFWPGLAGRGSNAESPATGNRTSSSP
jgi:molybdopterin-synthase adenylyltransferase